MGTSGVSGQATRRPDLGWKPTVRAAKGGAVGGRGDQQLGSNWGRLSGRLGEADDSPGGGQRRLVQRWLLVRLRPEPRVGETSSTRTGGWLGLGRAVERRLQAPADATERRGGKGRPAGGGGAARRGKPVKRRKPEEGGEVADSRGCRARRTAVVAKAMPGGAGRGGGGAAAAAAAQQLSSSSGSVANKSEGTKKEQNRRRRGRAAAVDAAGERERRGGCLKSQTGESVASRISRVIESWGKFIKSIANLGKLLRERNKENSTLPASHRVILRQFNTLHSEEPFDHFQRASCKSC
ncbi:hypothetical protein BT93_K0750 [Corymbia citriodora subsp. variegata]|nr:hypothetical protein BT93_K0750 [Corymbia citriodora subsp. variegata]